MGGPNVAPISARKPDGTMVLYSSEDNSCNTMINNDVERAKLGREVDACRRGKMPIRDYKKEMEIEKIGSFFGAYTKDNKVELQKMIERTLREKEIEAGEEKLESMMQIQALDTDSDDWADENMADEEEEEGLSKMGTRGASQVRAQSAVQGDRKGKGIAKY